MRLYASRCGGWQGGVAAPHAEHQIPPGGRERRWVELVGAHPSSHMLFEDALSELCAFCWCTPVGRMSGHVRKIVGV